jgi:hypothetical protein
MCLYPTLSRIIGLQIKLQNLQLTHALREIFSFMWVLTSRPSLFLVGFVFQFWLLSITFDAFFIWFFSFFSSRQHHVSAFSFHSSLQRLVEKVARRLLVWVLQIFFFIWCYSDFLESAFSKYCRFLRSFHCLWIYFLISLFPVSVEAFSDLRNLVMLHDVEVSLVSSVDHGSHLLKKHFTHTEKRNTFVRKVKKPSMRSIKD